MSPYLKFDVDHYAALQGEGPAPSATQEEQSSVNSESSKGTSPIARCPTSEGEEQSSYAPEKRNTQYSDERAAIFAIPAIPEAQSSENSKNSNPEPLTQHYPCVVCWRTQRWDDHGVWRCTVCWPSKER
jgi:hypothetical protein